jgi:hypothetical protein
MVYKILEKNETEYSDKCSFFFFLLSVFLLSFFVIKFAALFCVCIPVLALTWIGAVQV